MEIQNVITNGLFTTDQEALNRMTTERINAMLSRNSDKVKNTVSKLIDDGHRLKDYIAPLGAYKTGNPQITFDANGSVKMILRGSEYNITQHALSQTAYKLGVPGQYLRQLSSGDDWQRQLAATILNEHSGWSDRSRVLIRTVGDQVRGVLSDHYRRLNTMDIIKAFLEEVEKAGGMIADAFSDETKFAFETIVPQPVIIPTAKNGNIALAFGARISSSDYGDGSLQINAFILQGVCTNGLVRENSLKQIHLGRRLPDDVRLSERTYQLDTMTMASAVKDMTRLMFSEKKMLEKAGEIQRASETELDLNKAVKNLQKAKITKAEAQEVEEVLLQNNPDDGVAGEATLWKLVNGITAVARNKDERRKRELQEIAGQLMDSI